MGNIAYFEVPAEDIERAKKFYKSVFDWEIALPKMPMGDIPPDYHEIMTGKAVKKKNMSQLNAGGLMKRMMPGQGITNYVEVENIDETLKKAMGIGGKQIGEIMKIKGVGRIGWIMDSEGNAIGMWEPEKK